MTAKQEATFSDAMFDKAHDAAAMMKSLSNPGRLLTLCLLVDGEKSVAELADHLDAKQPAVSQQLARLRMEGLVAPRRDGRTIYYSIADERVETVLQGLYGAFCRA
jgi:DNA-binding transcriptional ArsR family regulator